MVVSGNRYSSLLRGAFLSRASRHLVASWRGYASAALLLLIVLVVNFNIVFEGESLVASANAQIIDYRSGDLKAGNFGGGNPSVNWHDLGCTWWQWEPAGKMFSRLYRAGRVPFWDPTVGGGQDSHTEVIQSQYYPPYLLLLLAGDTSVLRDSYYLLEVFCSGLFCFLLLRAHNCHYLSALGMGIAFMFSGAVTQNVNSVMGQSICVLPAMVWAADYALRRATWRSAGVASIVLAVASLSSFLPIVISGYLLVAIYLGIALAWPLFQTGSDAARPFASRIDWSAAARVSATLVVSALLIAFLLAPLELASSHSVFDKIYSGLGLQHWGVGDMLSLISPSVGYDVWQTSDPAMRLFTPAANSFVWYAGLLPLLLACLGCFGAPSPLRRLNIFFASAGAFLFLKIVGLPPAQWIGYLPVFHELHFVPYFCGALAFTIAGLAGIGIESLIRSRNRASLGVGFFAVTAFFVAILRFATAAPINPALTGLTLWNVVAHYGLEITRLALLAAGFLAVLILRTTGFQSGKSSAGLMIGLVLLDLAPLNTRNRFQRSDVWIHPPAYIHFLQSDHDVFRVNAVQALSANTSQPFGIQVLSSRLSFASVRYAGILRRYFDSWPRVQFQLTRSMLPSSRVLLDILNVKYLVAFSPSEDQQKQFAAAGLVPRFQDGQYRIFQNPSAWNRAYLADRAVSAPDGKALDTLAGLHPGEVLMEETPSIPLDAYGAAGSVDALHYDFDRISMRIHAARPALLVLDENYSPGWRASVDGKAARIYHANYSFQAIAVPAGDAKVEFHYVPPGFLAGSLLSGLGIALAAAMLFLGRGAPANREHLSHPHR